jgi:hypothetical protein
MEGCSNLFTSCRLAITNSPIIRHYLGLKQLSTYSLPAEHLCAVDIQKAVVDLVTRLAYSRAVSICRAYISANEFIRSLRTLHVDVLSVDVGAHLNALEPLFLYHTVSNLHSGWSKRLCQHRGRTCQMSFPGSS